MNALEARKLSEKKQLNAEKALEQIKSQAEYGNTATTLINLHVDAVTELMRLGYKISIHKDLINGMEHYVCSW